MKIFSYYEHKIILLSLIFFVGLNLQAQKLDSPILRTAKDTSREKMSMDAVYNRPFLKMGNSPLAVGGYLEANSLYTSENGISEGLSFEARLFTIFMSASITKRIKFLSELEFENGTKEIAIEFAAMDVSFHPMLNFRGGVMMNPIGAFNQNHDGPIWEFVERPTMANQLLPATWSNAGFGLYGKTNKGNWIIGYEAYLTNGFDNSIIDNEEGKTFLLATKDNPDRFASNNSGNPLLTGKIAIKNRNVGELGLSYMGGIYNNFEDGGLTLDNKRRLHVFALDFNTTINTMGTYIVGEYTFIMVDVPLTYTQQYGNKQQGFFIDLVQPIIRRKILDWEKASLNIAARLDYVDWNLGTFKETNTNIGDDLWAITPSIGFRPSSQTVFRLNYRYQWQKDILSNPPTRTAAWLFGFSTYF
ncbi:MAG: hypothetical protein CL840_00145 [Crocinitomicaceae bacterium]|nr:hypothetical protein [Crocinitomicaceae bacterium]|tara:strand:- start:1005 stop:2252 length:1248 start_codon:yes stop_codon:yes gene_type:complete